MSPHVWRWLDSLPRDCQVLFAINITVTIFFHFQSPGGKRPKHVKPSGVGTNSASGARNHRKVLMAPFLLLNPLFQIPKCCSSTGNLLWSRTSLRRGPLCTKDFAWGGRQGWECQWGNILAKLLTTFSCCCCHKHHHHKCGNQ